MFGKSILVAPVTQAMYIKPAQGTGTPSEDFSSVKTKEVYLPQGTIWYDFWTGEKTSGGKKVSKDTPMDIIPLYVKAGSIMPLGPKVQYAEEKKWDNLEIRVYPGANGTFTLYEDENDNYNYEKGVYSTIEFKWDDAKRTLTINDRKGSFPGMLKSRNFNIVMVGKGVGLDKEPVSSLDKAVKFTGKKVSIKL